MNSSLLADLRRNPMALGMAIALHLLIITVAVVSFSMKPSAPPASSPHPQVDIVKAEAIDAKTFDQSIKKQQQAEAQKRQQALEAQRKKAEAKKKAEQAKKQKAEQAKKQKAAEEQKRIALQKKKEAEKQKKAEEARRREEQKRKAAEEKRKAAEAKKQKEAEEKRKAEAKAEQERRAAILAAEEAQIKEQERLEAERQAAAARAEQERQQAIYNQRLAKMKESYIGAIQSHVTAHWRRPPGTQGGEKAEVYITQAPGGYILKVRVESCTGSSQFCKSVEDAVLRSEPLPQPSDKALFDREIRFTFRP
jgi:colicin import membrane protein